MSACINVDALARSDTFGRLARAELEQIAGTMYRRTYRRGAIIMHEGDRGESLFVVCSGHVKVMSPSETGDLAVLRVLGPGDLFGEMALLDGAGRSATIEAVDTVEAAILTRTELLAMLSRCPAAVNGLLTSLVAMIRRLSAEVGTVMYLDQPGRFAKKLLDLAESCGRPVGDTVEIDLPLTQEDLAAMIGARRPTVSRLMTSFEQVRLITRRGRRIVILNRRGLLNLTTC